MEYGIIGNKLTQSFSPKIHNMLGNNDYTKCVLKENELEAFLNERNFKGLNVTIPYKIEAMKYLDIISEEAKSIGAINTIVNKNGALHGFNTDAFGVEYALNKYNIDLNGKKILILGSGGSSRTVSYVCKKKKAAEVCIASRTGLLNYENLYDREWDFIFNTTPVGMYPNNNHFPIELKRIKGVFGVFDLVYNPLKTRFILEAESLGLIAISGIDMLIAQAKKSDDLFFGKNNTDDIIEDIVKKIYHSLKNIVLIGMPGCGKTTAGKILAQKTKRKWLDSDVLIALHMEKSIADIFKQYGENKFREIESNVIADISKNQSTLISLGGGAVLDKENMTAIKQNGIIIYIKRDIEKLTALDRPLIKNNPENLKLLYEARKPLYEKYADFTIDGNGTSENTANLILEVIDNEDFSN
ncbi:AAA family ATPase [Eubacteriales bacterium OttesenSCG-928-G02]|nr:AAA family ATPase [Eubacteriales bacterium OttesenSCG-928-G02]